LPAFFPPAPTARTRTASNAKTCASARNRRAIAPARALELLEMDIELNAQGLGIWLDRAR